MGRFLKWIVNIILLCAIVIAAALLIPPLAGVTTAMIDEVDMDTNLPRGSVTYARDVAADDLEAGDDVLILESGKTYVYRVKNLDTGDGTCTLEDTRTAGAEEVTRTFTGDVSKVVLTVPFIGYIPMAMKSTEGLIVIGLAVVFVIILFILAELWRPDRDDEEEEENPEPADEARQTLPVDTPSQIMEEASSEIASVVSSVVAEESQPEEIRQPEEDGELDEIDRKLRQEPEYLSEEEVLRQAEETDGTVTADGEEDAAILSLEEDIRSEEERMQEINDGAQEEIVLEQETVPEEESAVEETVIEEAALLEEPVSEEETMETAEEMTEEKIPAAEPYVPEQEVEEEVQTDERKLAMPLYTADELLAKAREKGENPRVVKDEKTGVTLLDYSDLL